MEEIRKELLEIKLSLIIILLLKIIKYRLRSQVLVILWKDLSSSPKYQYNHSLKTIVLLIVALIIIIKEYN